jgi:two-component system OmpR family sensor kinase
LGVPIVWFLIVFVGWLVTRSALNPVRRIIDSASKIDPAHMQDRLPVGEVDDELFRISVTINGMLDRLQEGFEREKQFAGDASHELRGPLAKILVDIDVTLARQREPAAYLEALGRCRRYARSLQQIAGSLLLLTTLDRKSVTTVTREVDIAELLMDRVSVLEEGRRSRVGGAIEESPAPLVVQGEPGLLQVALQNLLRNSLHYSSSSDPVDVHVARTPRGVSIEVRDQGPGIPAGQLERVFERFARLDNSRSRETGGVGLGLSIVKEILRVHGGSISLRNNPAGGLVATIEIPGAGNMPAPLLGSSQLSS